MRRSNRIFFLLGGLLMAASLILLGFLQIRTGRAERTNSQTVQVIESVLTDRREGSIDLDREPEMPVLELNGEDYIALLEIPSYGLKLPVYNIWDKTKVTAQPCRFYGSVYHGNLVIGGYDQPGQFDFFDRIQDGLAITLTDMTGCEFSYAVSCVERSDSAESNILVDDEADLTLFVRDAQLLEYIIIRCEKK